MNLQLISFNDFEKKGFGFYIMHHGKDDWGNFAALKVIKIIFALFFFPWRRQYNPKQYLQQTFADLSVLSHK